jgi:membrane protease YdiL (CAAX protease family)
MRLSTPREPIIVREASWATIVLVLVATFGLITTIALPAIISMMIELGDAAANLIIMGGIFVVAIGGIACLFGGLRPADVGLRSGKFMEAVIVVASAWIFIQLAHATAALLSSGSIQLDETWRFPGAIGKHLTWLVAMVVGTALSEETVFRGFVFPQLYLKSPGSPRLRFWVAALAAALLFGLLHVPRHIVLGNMTALALCARIPAHMVGGLIATLMYLRTRNLWIVIGLHGIDNAPTRLVDSPMPSEPVLLLVEIALLLCWPWLTRRPQHSGIAPILRDSASAHGR